MQVKCKCAIAIAELPHTCTVPGVGRSVLRTEREREREADVDVDPCTCSTCNATDRDLGESPLLAHPNQALTALYCGTRNRLPATDGTRPVSHLHFEVQV